MRVTVAVPIGLVPLLLACSPSRQVEVSSASPTETSTAGSAIESITAADVRHRIGIIADDSMMGRDTPSPGLEKTAAYIAREFERFGLKPAGDAGSYLQRYPLTRRKIDGAASSVSLRSGGATATASFLVDARFVAGGRTAQPASGPAIVVGGPVTAQTIASLDAMGKTAIYIADYTKPPQVIAQIVAGLFSKGPRAVLVISNRDSTLFAQRVAAQFAGVAARETGEQPGPPGVEVHERAVRAVLAAAGVDIAQIRASAQPVVREVPGLVATTIVRDASGSEVTAPNAVAILEGSDPELKNEYIVFSAHMDHVGVTRGATGDSINNGADDDASGTAGVLELAEAFTRDGARPKRSIIFLTVSGEEKGLWGSEYFVSHTPVPLKQIVANINIDMIGRNWKDTIVVIGKEHSDLGATLNRVNSAHPELGMNAIDDIWPQERFYFRSDHFNFARKGVPVLFFFNGVHTDYHRPGDSVDKIDAEKEMRILRLIYHIGQDVANAAQKPKWNPESYQKIVQVAQ